MICDPSLKRSQARLKYCMLLSMKDKLREILEFCEVEEEKINSVMELIDKCLKELKEFCMEEDSWIDNEVLDKGVKELEEYIKGGGDAGYV